jgi:hypothetical protein
MSKFVLKNVVVRWYGEITLKILKEKPIKSIRIKSNLNISIMYALGIIKFDKRLKFNFKMTFKNKVQF